MSLQHLKGHQDDGTSFVYEDAPNSVQLNIDMDSLSKEFLKTHQTNLEPKSSTCPLPTQKAYLLINDAPIHDNMLHHIVISIFTAKALRNDLYILHQYLLNIVLRLIGVLWCGTFGP